MSNHRTASIGLIQSSQTHLLGRSFLIFPLDVLEGTRHAIRTSCRQIQNVLRKSVQLHAVRFFTPEKSTVQVRSPAVSFAFVVPRSFLKSVVSLSSKCSPELYRFCNSLGALRKVSITRGVNFGFSPTDQGQHAQRLTSN